MGENLENAWAQAGKPADGSADAAAAADGREARIARRAAEAAQRLRDHFAGVVMTLALSPSYRHHPLSDIQHLAVTPLLHDRVLFARAGETGTVVAVAFWANLSEEAEARLSAQIAAGVLPPRLQAGDWNSGDRVWLLDIVSAAPKVAARLLEDFQRQAGDRAVRLHPAALRALPKEALDGLRRRRDGAADDGSAEAPERSAAPAATAPDAAAPAAAAPDAGAPDAEAPAAAPPAAAQAEPERV